MLPKQITKEMLAEKTDRELLELQTRYLAEMNEHARKTSLNMSFFFWLTVAGAAVALFSTIEFK